MNKETILKELRESIGNKDPIEFFAKFVDAFELLFDKLDQLESEVRTAKVNSALSISWDTKVAQNYLAGQIKTMQKDSVLFVEEIELLKAAYKEDKVTQTYNLFVSFWQETLGWHPFIDYPD